MGLKEFYHALEDKYYAALDWMDAHGIPVYGAVDAIEAQNIPSFPVAMLVLLLILGGLWFVFAGNLGGGNSLTITVIDGTQSPIPGARVELSGSGISTLSLLTDSRGKVTFSNLPTGVLLTLTASKDDYTFRDSSVTLDAGDNVARITGIAIPKNRSIALQLYQSGTTQSFSEPVELRFSCAGDSTFSATEISSGGRITLEDVPVECDTITVSSDDARVQLQSASIDATAAQPLLYLSLRAQGNAELNVEVVGQDALPLSGIEVVLTSAYGDPLQTKITDNAGRAKFTGVVADTYTVVAYDGAGKYASKTSPPTQVSGTNNTLSLVLEASAVGEVRLQVVDASNFAPIPSATVIISRGTQVLPSKRTDEMGKVSIPVSSGAGLSASIDHPNYLISVVPVSVSTAGYSTISLTRATAENSQVLTVQIKDELNNPVEGAQVALKKAVSGASVGATKTTGASGTVVFTSLEEGGYYVSAYKPGFSDQKRSDVVQVRARTNATLSVQLALGTGSVDILVQDDAGAAISGATIQIMDAITHTATANEIISDVEGKASLTLRADKTVYFVVSEGAHSTVTTIPLAVKKSINQSVSVEMPKSVSKLETKILQLWLKGQPLESDSALVPGQTYTAVMGLYVPDSSDPTEAGIHVRTGNSDEGKTNPIENDDWYIRDVRAAHSTIKRGTTYTPPIGLGIDNQNLTSGNAKWATVAVQNPHDGLTLIEVDLQVKDTAIQGVDLPLYYRAYSKSGSYTRFPLDAVLGGSDSTGDKQNLYANANLKSFGVGNTSSTCMKDMCVALVLEDLQTKLQSPVFNETEVDVSTSHRLGFVFRSLSDAVLQDTKIQIKSSTASAELKAFEVVNAVGVKKTGTAQGNVVDVALGTVQRDNVITGFVNFAASKEGSSNVTLSIISGKNEIFKRELRVKVNAASVFDVEVLPQALLPLLTNQILVKAFVSAEGGRIGLENVAVTLKKNGTTLASGFTDGEGIFPYELNEPNVGDVIEFTLEKAGYRPLVKTIRVGDNIVLFSPNQINENLIINGVSRKTREVRLTNLASIPLKLKEIKMSGGFEDLVKFELLSDALVGSEIAVNGDANIAFALSLTEKGMKLLNAQTFNGAIVVSTETTTSGKEFVNALPAIIKAGFGGEVDDAACLVVEPLKWDIFTNTNEKKQLGFEIKNNCKVKGEPVRLVNLSAKIKQIAGDLLGTFTATASDGKSAELGSGFKVVADSLSANGSATVTVQFSPGSILSGVATPQLVFQATNLTQGGVEDNVSETVKLNLVVNDLTKCLEVKTPQSLTIESCPINLGFGQYGNYFNQGLYQPTGVPYYNPSFSVLNQTTNPSGTSLLPSNQSGFGFSPYNQGSSIYNPYYNRNTLNSGYYGSTGYNGLGQYNPNGQPFSPATGNYAQLNGYYANPLVDSYNNRPGGYANYASGCGSTEVRIENSCQSEVDVQLDADPNLQTSANTFSLKPNTAQRVRIASGVRIGRYPFIVNAKAKGSTDATTEVANLAVLIKSPTEVNGDCISLDRTKYSFNEFVQTPVKGKVYNNCYDQGVRLVERGDTVTLSSFFNPDATQEVVLDPRTVPGAIPRNNTLVNSIQTTGLSTKGNSDGGTIQVYEFQIFPDFQTYKRQLAPGQQGGLGEKLLDIKSFAEKNYYRVESYGVISVKYLDAFSAAQQKQFPVIFENLFKLASALDALIGGGSPAITNFQDCINVNALQSKAVTSDGKAVTALSFGDTDFKRFTTFTYITQFPDSVIKVADTHCGGQDYLSKLNPTKLTSQDDEKVFATFQVIDKRDIQVTINRPLTLAKDVVIEGNLQADLTRTFVNAGTQRVTIPVKITVQRLKTPQNNNALQLQACTAEGYVSGSNFSSRYGFDKLSWDWTFNGSPDCSEKFCDATQLFLYLAKDKVKKFNQFLSNNTNAFTSPERHSNNAYSTRKLILDIHESVQDIKDATSTSASAKAFFVSKSSSSNNEKLVRINPASPAKPIFDQEMQRVKDASVDLLAKEKGTPDKLAFVNTMQTALNKIGEQNEKNQWMIVLSEEKLRTKSGSCRNKSDPNCDSTLQRVMTLLGAETRGKYLYWSYGEFDAFHSGLLRKIEANNDTKIERFEEPALLNYLALQLKNEGCVFAQTPAEWQTKNKRAYDNDYIAHGNLQVGPTFDLSGSPVVTVIPPTPPAVEIKCDVVTGLNVYTGMLQDITNSIEDVVLAFGVPSDGSNISDVDRAYVLEKAKTVKGFVGYEPFGKGTDAAAAKAFNDQFLKTTVMLLPDTYDATFRAAFAAVEEQGYDYKRAIESTAGAGAGSFDAIRDMQFLDSVQESISITPNAADTFSIAAPGKYQMNLDALWHGGSKTANILAAYVDKSTTAIPLETIDAQNNPQTTYAENPFMYMSFDGLTGAGAARTFGVGQTSTLVNNATALNLNGKIAISTQNNANITTYIDKSGTTAWANSIAQFTQKMQRPALFGLQQSGTNWNFDFAPNRPAPVQVSLFSSRSPIYQYIVADVELARTTGLYTYDPAIMTWLNCSDTTAAFFTANTVSSGNSLSCNPTRAGDFVLNGNAVGTDARFIGLALLPPGKIPLYMYPICADETVDVRNAKGQKGTLSIDNPGTQLSQLELTSTLEAPESLAQMIELINKGTACATIDKEKLNIIWNLGSPQVVPAALACQSGGSGPAPLVPQGTNSGATPTPAPATAPGS